MWGWLLVGLFVCGCVGVGWVICCWFMLCIVVCFGGVLWVGGFDWYCLVWLLWLCFALFWGLFIWLVVWLVVDFFVCLYWFMVWVLVELVGDLVVILIGDVGWIVGC